MQTVPVVCMHCEQPTCAEVCPADAIKRTGDGVVQSARKPRCIACGNCVIACPFGVPEVYEDRQIMMKCDMCYDRTASARSRCAPRSARARRCSSARASRSSSCGRCPRRSNQFQFGDQTITTRVFMMVPQRRVAASRYVDVTAAMDEQPRERVADRADARIVRPAAADPFAEVEV